jgi:hypothetical protein
MPIILGVETLTLPDGTEVDVRIGLGLSIEGYRPVDHTPPYIVSGSCGPDPTVFTLVFSEAVTWPGSDPHGLVIEVPDGNGVGAIAGVVADWNFTYVSGKGTSTLVVSGDGGVTSGIPVIGYFNSAPPGDLDAPGNITDLAGNALTPFGHVGYTNLVP